MQPDFPALTSAKTAGTHDRDRKFNISGASKQGRPQSTLNRVSNGHVT
jgi:hypothetical protein